MCRYGNALRTAKKIPAELAINHVAKRTPAQRRRANIAIVSTVELPLAMASEEHVGAGRK